MNFFNTMLLYIFVILILSRCSCNIVEKNFQNNEGGEAYDEEIFIEKKKIIIHGLLECYCKGCSILLIQFKCTT